MTSYSCPTRKAFSTGSSPHQPLLQHCWSSRMDSSCCQAAVWLGNSSEPGEFTYTTYRAFIYPTFPDTECLQGSRLSSFYRALDRQKRFLELCRCKTKALSTSKKDSLLLQFSSSFYAQIPYVTAAFPLQHTFGSLL